MRPPLVMTAIAVAALASSSADGHVAPSLDVNNRYLKLTPMRDRVRLAYTIYFGEQPGAEMRRRLDRDRNGQLTADETEPLADELAARVAAALEITFDGQSRPVSWTLTDIGLGTPTTDAGSFSVDLITQICAPEDGASHQLVLFDRFEIERPGETEIRIEESPDVEVTRATLGEGGPSMLSMKWNGNRGPTAIDGLHLAYQVGADAEATDDQCTSAAPTAAGDGDDDDDRPPRLLIAGGLAALFALGGAIVAVAVARKRRRGT